MFHLVQKNKFYIVIIKDSRWIEIIPWKVRTNDFYIILKHIIQIQRNHDNYEKELLKLKYFLNGKFNEKKEFVFNFGPYWRE